MRGKLPYPLSAEFVQWAESVAGMLTKIETQHGGIYEMMERPQWDESATGYAIELVGDLMRHLGELHKEMSDHVSQKPF